MGDLYGPYFVSNSSLPAWQASGKARKKKNKQELAASFILGGDSKRGKKRKRTSAESAMDGSAPREDETEIW